MSVNERQSMILWRFEMSKTLSDCERSGDTTVEVNPIS